MVGVRIGEFSSGLEAVFVFWVSREVHRHVFDDGDVSQAVGGSRFPSGRAA